MLDALRSSIQVDAAAVAAAVDKARALAQAHPVVTTLVLSLCGWPVARRWYAHAHRRTARGRRVLLTGAGSGIGKVIAQKLAAKGWVVFALDVNAQALEALRQEVGPGIRPLVCSVANDAQVKAAVGEVAKDGGSLHALVNVAGIAQVGAAADQSEEEMLLVMQINALGTMRMCRECVPLLLRSRDGGHVVNVTSSNGKVAWPWSGCYAAAKGAVELFSDSVRREAVICDLPLRVSVVAPGAVLTPLLDAYTDKIVKWTDDHTASAFYKGCRSSAMLQLTMKQNGWSAGIVAVTAEAVADTVIGALEAYRPKARYVVMHPLFAIMYYIPSYLPARWGDWFLKFV